MPGNVRFVVRDVEYADGIIKRLSMPEDVAALHYAPDLAGQLTDSLVFLEISADRGWKLFQELLDRGIPTVVVTRNKDAAGFRSLDLGYRMKGARDYLFFGDSEVHLNDYREDISLLL